MPYSKAIRDKVLNLLLKGHTATKIAENDWAPSYSTISRWKKDWVNEGVDFSNVNLTNTRYSKEIVDKVFNLLLEGGTASEIAKSDWMPSYSTINKWKKDWVSKGIDFSNADPTSTIYPKVVKDKVLDFDDNKPLAPKVVSSSKVSKATGREGWGIKKYSKEQQDEGIAEQNSNKELWEGVKGYNPEKLDFIESVARAKYHGTSLEDELHLGIYQVSTRFSSTARTKKVTKEGSKKAVQIKLTSQDHIFPDARISDKENSYHPENVREGNATVNTYINAKIDPVIEKNGKIISESTVKMLKKYNFTNSEEDHVPFKYYNDRIVTSNLVKKLDVSAGGSFEAPELGLLKGYKALKKGHTPEEAQKQAASMAAYSVPLYKLNTAAGVIDVATCNKNLLKILGSNFETSYEDTTPLSGDTEG